MVYLLSTKVSLKSANHIFSAIQDSLLPSLERAGFTCADERYDEQVFGSQFTLFRSSFAHVRLTWDGKDRCLILECDRLAGERRPGPWLDLYIAKLQDLEHSDELSDELGREFQSALDGYLEQW